MEVKQNPRTVDEVCKKGQLEEHRDTIKAIFTLINEKGCKIATRYERPTSSVDWSAADGPIIRLNLLSNKEPIHIIWSLLHEYGHFLSGKPATARLDDDQQMAREVLAWEHADQQLIEFPELCECRQAYHQYRAACLKTYEDKRKM
ncbi:hypothetical protein HF329_33255 [Chitinophaga oryzae]|uniref:Uncharacterized protein n=1 Tax=Chitinophaga oryzae TaxID=2725414 RepID=A0AAE6ZPC1_9BACT|nr:hypothetical protein [Chitinophaga oryzae]QJB35918.1 hypothetical protein HF329_33255 [Chitinophaga oryzae]